MEKVVYLLGAGFSAPFGLPVMSNFIERAKDIYFSDTSRHEKLAKVIENLSKVGNHYFKSDIFNIEEVLSVLSMKKTVGAENNTSQLTREDFVEFLKYVIERSTQQYSHGGLSGGWKREIFGRQTGLSEYGFYALSLFNAFVTRNSPRGETVFDASVPDSRNAEYSIVTLNYDMVLENAMETFREKIRPLHVLVFADTPHEERNGGTVVPLLKLHGSVDKGDMIPPIWNKDLSDENIKIAWTQAYKCLHEATQIRIIGYSLPDTDTNVRYLLKISTMDPPNLKKIDALFLDRRDEIARRYKAFLTFPKFRWKDADVFDYLSQLMSATLDSKFIDASNINIIKCNHLEDAHDAFFKDSHDLDGIEG